MHVRSVEGDERVTPLELFFDLVFVFAITQVTTFLAANDLGGPPPRSTPLRGTLVGLGGVRLADQYPRPRGRRRPACRLRLDGGMLIVALATPSAFGSEALIFGVAYFLVRALHIVLYRSPAAAIPNCFGRSSGSLPAPSSGRC